MIMVALIPAATPIPLSNSLVGEIPSNWKFVMALLPWLIVLLPFAYYKSNVMNVLNLGDQTD
jgi:iron complex transport system permease protein